MSKFFTLLRSLRTKLEKVGNVFFTFYIAVFNKQELVRYLVESLANKQARTGEQVLSLVEITETSKLEQVSSNKFFTLFSDLTSKLEHVSMIKFFT